MKEDPNYNITVVDGKFTIIPATVTVVADNKSVLVGDEMPEFTVTYYGLTNSDTVEDLITPATVQVEEGANTSAATEEPYKITVFGAESNNYVFEYVDGTFTVSLKQNEIFDVQMMRDWTYGDFVEVPTANAVYGAETMEFHYSEAVENNGELSYGEYLGTEMPTNAGTYFVDIYVPATAEYTDAHCGEIITILPREARITVGNMWKSYGEPVDGLKYCPIFFDNFLYEDEQVFAEYLAGELWADVNESTPVGEYEITIGGAPCQEAEVSIYDIVGNYNINVENGTFYVRPLEINAAIDAGIVKVSEIDNVTFNYNEHRPTVEIIDTVANVTLVQGHDGEFGPTGDYTLGYSDNRDAGKATVEVYFHDNFEGELRVPFIIEPKALPTVILGYEDMTGTSIELPYTEHEMRPWINVVEEGVFEDGDGNYYLEDGRDYYVEWPEGDFVNAGTYTVEVKAAEDSNYTGSTTATFTITQAQNFWHENDGVAGVRLESWHYGDMPWQPWANARFGEDTIVYEYFADEDCTEKVVISNTTDAGTYYVRATIPATDNYSGLTSVCEFNIMTTMFDMVEMDDTFTYNGKAQKPEVTVYGIRDDEGNPTVLVEGKDYVLTYVDDNPENDAENKEDLTNVGYKEVIVEGIGNYAGCTWNMGYFVEPFSIEADMITGLVDKVYTGDELTQTLTVTVDGKELTEGKDFVVEYLPGTNVNVGTAFLFVNGINNYTGTNMLAFQITPAKLADATLAYTTVEADGTAKNPVVTVKGNDETLVYGEDYFLVYGNNVLPGTATVTVIGIGNYAGSTIEKTFKITAPPVVEPVYDLTDATLEYSTVVFDGTAKTPTVVVFAGTEVAELDRDYIVTYDSNVNAGTAKVTIKGVGNYKGDVIEKTFQIEKADNTWTKELTIEDWTYGDEANAPTATAKDGTVTYAYYKVNVGNDGIQLVALDKAPTEVGLYVVKAAVAATDNYNALESGYVDFNISPKSLADDDVVVSGVVDKEYTGEAVTQDDLKVTIDGKELIIGKDIEVSYENNIEAGTATVTIKAASGGNYTESVKVTFEIVKKDEVIQVYGKLRYHTAMGVAEQLKEEMGVDKFNTIIVATGEDFADALSGSYLSYVKNAPILLINERSATEVTAYINANLVSGGKVYVLGGDAAIEDSWIKGIKSSNIDRLSGRTRYETNIEILKEAGVTSGQILVATGRNFADSLSAASAKKPIFLVDGNADTLRTSQKEYLSGLRGDSYYIIGGEAAVSEAMEDVIADYGTIIDRVKGKDRYGTSIAVAETFVPNPESAVVAWGKNFPDGLCGGLLAVVSGSPVILSSEEKAEIAKDYIAEHGITDGYVLGGDACFKDSVVAKIFGIETDNIVKFRYPDNVK